jgi:GDP-4-dehydro-6-deoxy-D-mannose reductase
MRLLVTGATGFVGTHLLEFLRRAEPSVELYALVRRGVERAALPKDVTTLEADIEHAASVDAAFERCEPDAIVHLAAQSSVHQSWLDPEGTLKTNLLGTLHLLEALRQRRLRSRVLLVGSADEYGAVLPGELPLREEHPLRPASPYAVSKVAQGFLGLQYALSSGIDVVRTRTFPHTGPGRGEIFAESSFAKQLVAIERGRRPAVLEVGNLDPVRDFTDVRDVVRAYWALVRRGAPGEVYNVCSGRGISMREVVSKLRACTRVEVEVEVDPNRLRPADIPALVGEPRRLREATGWTPEIPFDRTLQDLLEHWRGRAAA